MGHSTYKKKVDLLKDVDWVKVTEVFDALKRHMVNMSYQAPEHINSNYHGLVTLVGYLAKELLLFDRTATYHKALEDILKLQGEYAAVVDEARTIAKAALDSAPDSGEPAPAEKSMDGEQVLKWLMPRGTRRTLSLDRAGKEFLVILSAEMDGISKARIEKRGLGRTIDEAFADARAKFMEQFG